MNKHDEGMDHHACLIRLSQYSDYRYPESDLSVIFHDSEKFGIDEARSLSAQSQLRPATNEGQVFIIRTGFITHEAQNALLKLFEEPPNDTRFVLVVPPALQLLSTLRSRIGIEKVLVDDSVGAAQFENFWDASIANRLKQIDVWHKAKDQHWLQQITVGVHTMNVSELTLGQREVVRFVGTKLQTRGASNKMLIEHLALTLPLRK